MYAIPVFEFLKPVLQFSCSQPVFVFYKQQKQQTSAAVKAEWSTHLCKGGASYV